jgi:hypothetical protein
MKHTSGLGDFLTGLDGPDTIAVERDFMLLGQAFVEVVAGKKRRLAPCGWPAVAAPQSEENAA